MEGRKKSATAADVMVVGSPVVEGRWMAGRRGRAGSSEAVKQIESAGSRAAEPKADGWEGSGIVSGRVRRSSEH